jgi:hypothetical protein
MGLLGIICVSINEKIKKHKRLKMKQHPQKAQDSKLFTSHPKASNR